jgi:hypothetical protein
MKEFFDKRSAMYDAHIEKSVAAFKELYTLITEPISPTEKPIKVLDIGAAPAWNLRAFSTVLRMPE